MPAQPFLATRRTLTRWMKTVITVVESSILLPNRLREHTIRPGMRNGSSLGRKWYASCCATMPFSPVVRWVRLARSSFQTLITVKDVGIRSLSKASPVPVGSGKPGRALLKTIVERFLTACCTEKIPRGSGAKNHLEEDKNCHLVRFVDVLKKGYEKGSSDLFQTARRTSSAVRVCPDLSPARCQGSNPISARRWGLRVAIASCARRSWRRFAAARARQTTP